MDIQRKKDILKNISLKRQYRYEKKMELLGQGKKNKIPRRMSIGTQTEKQKEELEIEIFDVKINDNTINPYKEKYFSKLIGLNVKINETLQYKRLHLNKYDNQKVNIFNQKELIFFDNFDIIIKVEVVDNKFVITYKKQKIKIEKISSSFVIEKKILKINEKNIFSVKENINYYYIKN